MARADLTHGLVMPLGLSSAAAPDASFDELVQASRTRGIEVLELREGDASLIDDVEPSASGAAIVGIIPSTNDPEPLFRSARATNASVIIAGNGTALDRINVSRKIAEHGVRALPLLGGPSIEWLDTILDCAVEWAWDVDATTIDLAHEADAVLRDARCVPAYIRLVGGGPESAMNDGRGIGTLMARLALAGYDGPLILVPSSARFRIAWSKWLGRRGGWGCGSKVADPSLVQLHGEHAW